ncbi:DUF6349 family protein [Streptomyces zaomyceticus]|uniref:DUF6349 family protein n=1 Tax=Streptomyces zaomyceticus TaxID=68286 RepID=UPI00379E0C06
MPGRSLVVRVPCAPGAPRDHVVPDGTFAPEDAHDHTHPGRRDLAIFERSRTGEAGAAWERHVRAVHPDRWFEAAGVAVGPEQSELPDAARPPGVRGRGEAVTGGRADADGPPGHSPHRAGQAGHPALHRDGRPGRLPLEVLRVLGQLHRRAPGLVGADRGPADQHRRCLRRFEGGGSRRRPIPARHHGRQRLVGHRHATPEPARSRSPAVLRGPSRDRRQP